MSEKIKIAIYGGTFNPPHIGHIRAAESFMNAISADELLIVPTLIPPHKVEYSGCDPMHRLKMCQLAFSHISHAEVSDIEIRRGGKSYTYMTLQEISADERELYFLCGTDMLLTMDTWKCPEIIFALSKICYIQRECDSRISAKIHDKIDFYKRKYGAEIIKIDAEAFEISSTYIREAIKTGEDISCFLSAPVYEYIKKVRLYQ